MKFGLLFLTLLVGISCSNRDPGSNRDADDSTGSGTATTSGAEAMPNSTP